MGGILNEVGCYRKSRYHNSQVSHKRCSKAVSGTVAGLTRDKYIKAKENDNTLNLKEHKPNHEAYSKVYTFDVEAGTKPQFAIHGTVTKESTLYDRCTRKPIKTKYESEFSHEGISLNDCANEYKNNACYITCTRKDGRDYYTIGIFKDFKGTVRMVDKNGKMYDVNTDNTNNIDSNSKTDGNVEAKPEEELTNEDPLSEIKEAKKKVQDMENALAKAKFEETKAINNYGKQLPLLFDSLISETPESFKEELKKIKAELLANGTNNSISLEKASVKLKLAALKYPQISKKANELVDLLRTNAKEIRNEVLKSGKTITTFGIGESGRNYNYNLQEAYQGKISVEITGGGFWDSKNQKDLNDAMKKVNETGDWSDFDKALELIVTRQLNVYFKDK